LGRLLALAALSGCFATEPLMIDSAIVGANASDPNGQLARCEATGLSEKECCASHQEVPACQ
jgi:hypothetical protein